MIIDILYNVFIYNEWLIPVICMAYGGMVKRLVTGRRYELRRLIPVSCIFISMGIHLIIPEMNYMYDELFFFVSNSIYEGLVACGIYELCKSTKRLISLYRLKRKK